MARFLGIDWDTGPNGHPPLLRVVEASVKHGQVTLHRAVSWAETLVPNLAQAQEAGQRLRQHLQEAGIAPAPVLYAVGRGRVVFRDVRFPDVPEEEVAAVVHLQAAGELPFSAEEAVLDYAPSCPAPSGERRALVFVLRKELLQAIRQTCQAAGLRLEGVSVRPFALLANCETQAGAGGDGDLVRAAFVVTNGEGELCVARGPEMLFSRAVAPGDGQANGSASFLPELRRSLAAYAAQFPQYPVQTLYVADGNEAAEDEVLAERLDLDVVPFEPMPRKEASGLANPEAFAGALGLIQARARGRLPVDFLAPKEPRPPVNLKRRYTLAAAAGAAVLIVAVATVYGVAAHSRDNQIAALQAQVNDQEKDIQAFGDVGKRVADLTTWDHEGLVYLDEIYDVFARFPDVSGVRITKLEWKAQEQKAGTVAAAAAPHVSAESEPAAKGTPVPGNLPKGFRPLAPAGAGSAAKEAAKPVGLLTIEAQADSMTDLERLGKALADADRHWELFDWDDDPSKLKVRATLKVFYQPPRDYRILIGPNAYTTAEPAREKPRAEAGGDKPPAKPSAAPKTKAPERPKEDRPKGRPPGPPRGGDRRGPPRGEPFPGDIFPGGPPA